MLEVLKTIAGNVQPPLPTPLMGAAILFVFCTSLPARLAAAWGLLVRSARSVFTEHAPPKGLWVRGVSRLVLWVDLVLSPFKLEDWEARARDAEDKLKAAESRVTTAEDRASKLEILHQKIRAIIEEK